MNTEDDLLRRLVASQERTEAIARRQAAKPVASDYVNAAGRGAGCGCLVCMLVLIFAMIEAAIHGTSGPANISSTSISAQPEWAALSGVLVHDVVKLIRPGKPDCKAEVLEIPTGQQTRYMVRPIDGPDRDEWLNVESSVIKALSQ
jgi:hypothetical protein